MKVNLLAEEKDVLHARLMETAAAKDGKQVACEDQEDDGGLRVPVIAAREAEGPGAVTKLVAHARETGHTPFVLRLLSYLLSLDLSVDRSEETRETKNVSTVKRKVTSELGERSLVV
jgi:hypothetical protein